MRWEAVDALADFDKERWDIVVVKRQATTEHDVQNHAAAPNIDFGPRVQAAGDDLGRGVVGTAAAGFEKVAVAHQVGEAKVADLDVEKLVEQQVFGLEVAVGDLVLVAVVCGRDDLLKEAARFAFRQAPVVDNVLEQLAARVLEDHDNVRRRRDDLVELDDMGVAEHAQELDLALDPPADVHR